MGHFPVAALWSKRSLGTVFSTNHDGRGVVKRIAELPADYRLHGHVIVIATHEALLRSDFSGFAGWQIVIDEVPRFLDFEEKHTPLDFAFFQRHYVLTPMEGNWSTVEPTGAGRALAAKDGCRGASQAKCRKISSMCAAICAGWQAGHGTGRPRRFPMG